MRVQVLTVAVMGLLLSGCMTTEEFGSGMAIGGIGAGSAPIAVIGMITEIIGGATRTSKSMGPKFEERSKEQREDRMESAIMLDLQNKITAGMTPDQAKAAADEYCDRIKSAVSTGKPIVISREPFVRLMTADLLPDDDEFQHTLKSDPIKGGCQNLDKAAQQKLSTLRKNG